MAAGPITKPAGEGPAPILMHGKREDMRVIVKGVLHAIAVVRVNIHVKQRRQPLIAPGEQAQHRIIHITKAGSAIRPAMMRATAWHMHHPARGREPCRQQDTARAGGGAAKYLAIDRIAIGADAKSRPIFGAHALGCLGAHQGRDIVGAVEALQFFGRSAWAFDVVIDRA
jgi:hypothetical protein